MLVLKCLECGEIHEIEECEKEAAGQFGCARCCGGELDIIDEYETGKGFYCPCGCRGNLDECVYASTQGAKKASLKRYGILAGKSVSAFFRLFFFRKFYRVR
jgi:hypothetical protein